LISTFTNTLLKIKGILVFLIGLSKHEQILMHTVANVYSGAGMMSLYSSWHHTGWFPRQKPNRILPLAFWIINRKKQAL